jgi:zinc and cadmium transporter
MLARCARRRRGAPVLLLADGLHNFIGGLAIGASFIVSTEVGVITWIAAAAHGMTLIVLTRVLLEG